MSIAAGFVPRCPCPEGMNTLQTFGFDWLGYPMEIDPYGKDLGNWIVGLWLSFSCGKLIGGCTARPGIPARDGLPARPADGPAKIKKRNRLPGRGWRILSSGPRGHGGAQAPGEGDLRCKAHPRAKRKAPGAARCILVPCCRAEAEGQECGSEPRAAAFRTRPSPAEAERNRRPCRTGNRVLQYASEPNEGHDEMHEDVRSVRARFRPWTVPKAAARRLAATLRGGARCARDPACGCAFRRKAPTEST